MIGPEAYVENAAALWSELAVDAHRDQTCFRAELSRSTRLILRAPMSTDGMARLLDSAPRDRHTVLEDVFGGGAAEPVDPTVRVLRMPVMVRPPGTARPAGPVTPAGTVSPAGPVTPAGTEHRAGTVSPAGTAGAISDGDGVRIDRVSDPEELAVAERIIVEGFPLPAFLPWRRGEALPDRVLTVSGWRAWLAYRRGEPAAATYTYDDGRIVGLYGLVTLPAHRSAGLGRALLAQAIEAYPDRPFTLVATEAGRPIYEALGYHTVATAGWYLRSPVPPPAADR